MVLEKPWAQKRMLWAFEKGIFQFFTNFWVTKLKPFSGKVRQSIQNALNQNLAIGSFLENGFEATWSSKTNVLSLWTVHFSNLCRFFSDNVETIFWESEERRSKLLKSNLFIRSFLENSFGGTLSSKTNVVNVWKGHFSFFTKFWVTKLKPFSGKVRQGVQKYLNQNLVIGSFF